MFLTKRKIKMIVTDLDGTLLRTDKSISEFTRAVLEQRRKSGIKLVYATGRGGSADRVAPAELFDGRVTMNGAVAHIEDALVYCRLIPYLAARPVLLACDKRGLNTTSECSGMHYSNFVVSAKWPQITDFELVDFSLHDIDAEKLYALVNNPEDVLFIESLLPKDLYLSLSRDGMAMIMHRDATKAKAVAELARIWGISASEIAAFGDDLNDMDMLEYAGAGVAMGNAVEEIKAAADFVCLSNDEDGLAEWIISNILS